jgi:Mg/Co/Ni transporter MgtE
MEFSSGDQDAGEPSGQVPPGKEPLITRTMKREFLYCHPEDSFAATLELMKAHGLTSLPVVDSNLRIIGMLHADDVQ